MPRLVDKSLRTPAIGELREPVCAGLTGRVLELGFGSGLNTRFYPAEVESVDAVEPSDLGLGAIASAGERAAPASDRVGLDGQALDADDAAYDCCAVHVHAVHDPRRGAGAP